MRRHKCWKKWHLQAASGEHSTGHPRPPLPLDHLWCWDAIDSAGEGLGASLGVDAWRRGFLLMDAWRNCKDQSDIVSSCRPSHCTLRPGTALPRPTYRQPGHYSSLALRATQAQQVIFKQIQVTSFLLSLVSELSGCCRAQSTGHRACWRQISRQQCPSSTFLAGICFLHDWNQFLLWEKCIGASHPEELFQIKTSSVWQLPCSQVHISQGHPQQHLQLHLGSGPQAMTYPAQSEVARNKIVPWGRKR